MPNQLESSSHGAEGLPAHRRVYGELRPGLGNLGLKHRDLRKRYRGCCDLGCWDEKLKVVFASWLLLPEGSTHGFVTYGPAQKNV